MDNEERKRRFGASWDADALAYFAAASITNNTEKRAANKLIKALKSAGVWTKLDRIYLRSPTSLAACLMCCKSLTSQTAVNSPTFGSSGLTFNGTTQYCVTDAGFISMANITTTSASAYCMFSNGLVPNFGICGRTSGVPSNYFILLGDTIV